MSNYWLMRGAGLAILAGVASFNIAGTAFASGLPPIRCDANDKVNDSSSAWARKKMNAAGYQKVHGLKKGCDSYWHGEATMNGSPTHVSLSPQGVVLPEGD
jgi:hypothetical protein